MGSYNVVVGDTFELVARKTYGDETKAGNIASANPGVTEPLIAGTNLVIPDLPEAPQDIQGNVDAVSEDEIALTIEGKRFRFWDGLRLIRSIDSIDSAEFGTPFESDLPEFRNNFRPLSYNKINVTMGGVPFFTGTMVKISPIVEINQKILSVGCYSLPGALNDCMAPSSISEKLEFSGQGLKEIAESLAKPFGIGVKFTADQGAIFETAAIKTTETILSFLIELAKQRNLIISSTEKGELLFQQSVKPGTPVARLKQGQSPVISITPEFNEQEYYSHVTGFEPVDPIFGGSKYTVKNDRLKGVLRPFNFEVPDTTSGDVKNAVQAKIGRMFGNLVTYTIEVDTWRDPKGALWAPNTTITLTASDAMVYNEYEFIIRSVDFNRDGSTKTAALSVVIPGAFSGEIPEALPWDE